MQTNPAGATVVIDGQQRGMTPLNLQLKPGRHVVELVTDGDVRSIPVMITPGGQVSQFIEIPRAASALGELQIRTEPAGATVTVDGRVLGKSPLTAEGLTPGPHTVTCRERSRSGHAARHDRSGNDRVARRADVGAAATRRFLVGFR